METTIKRLNWGCGSWTEPGWINCDIKDDPGIDISCNILDGLPLDENSIDYVVSIHALPEIPYPEIGPVLTELRRVLKEGGVLRLCLPDLDKGIEAYRSRQKDYFLIPDEDVTSLGGKFIVHMLWYGYSRTLFTVDFTEELLRNAGFSEINQCQFKETKSRFGPGILELDNREAESLFIEAVK